MMLREITTLWGVQGCQCWRPVFDSVQMWSSGVTALRSIWSGYSYSHYFTLFVARLWYICIKLLLLHTQISGFSLSFCAYCMCG